MLISEITLRNFKSYGNNKQTLKLNTEKGDLILIVGKNGSGKCVDPSTEIEIEIDFNSIEHTQDLINYLGKMGQETPIIFYIKENYNNLYEKVTNNRNK